MLKLLHVYTIFFLFIDILSVYRFKSPQPLCRIDSGQKRGKERYTKTGKNIRINGNRR